MCLFSLLYFYDLSVLVPVFCKYISPKVQHVLWDYFLFFLSSFFILFLLLGLTWSSLYSVFLLYRGLAYIHLFCSLTVLQIFFILIYYIKCTVCWSCLEFPSYLNLHELCFHSLITRPFFVFLWKFKLWV